MARSSFVGVLFSVLSIESILISYMLCVQPQEKGCDTVFYDVKGHSPVFKLFNGNDSLRAYYYKIKDIVDFDVAFDGSVDGLRQYFDSLYFAHFDEKSYVE